MPKRHIRTVTMEGMTKSQPGVSVGTVNPAYYYKDGEIIQIPGKVRLNVSRHYNDLKNEFGGKGVIKHLDHHGRLFDSTEEANAFALEKGYLRPFFNKKGRDWDIKPLSPDRFKRK